MTWLRRTCALLLGAVLVLSGCGVSATDRPTDEGDAESIGSPSDYTRSAPPEPEQAQTADDLVRNFLQAAAGGLGDANERVKRYLTGDAAANWIDPIDVQNPDLILIRIVSGPTRGAFIQDRGILFTVEYERVGTLTGHGRVDELADLEPPRQLTFWVTSEDFSLRIREIIGWPDGQLLLSDEGLDRFYQKQPIYFWDKDYETLVPDLRYVPLTINPDQRARLRLNWLAAGPSLWLAPGVQTLPAGISPEPVTTTDGKLHINLSTVAAGEPEAMRRLLFQLQWSLTDLTDSIAMPEAKIELSIGGQPVPVQAGETAFHGALHSYWYRGQPHRYQIRDGVVHPVGTTPAPAVLTVPQNSFVTSAAVSADQRVAALVRDDRFGGHSLYIVRDGQAPINVPVPTTNDLGRPSFVPGTDLLLVPTGGPDGKLLSVSTVDGSVADASRPIGVTVAVISPDGRRVAYVADGAVYVAPLVIGSSGVTVGPNPRQLLADRLTATTITWTSESWLVVAGTRGNDEPALWRVTADGAVAYDLSDRSFGLRVSDLVCFPDWLNTRDGDAEVLAVTDQGVYTFRTQFATEPNLTAPFYGS